VDENHSNQSFSQNIDDAYEHQITDTPLTEDTIEETIEAEFP